MSKKSPSAHPDAAEIIALGKAVINDEAIAVKNLVPRINDDFVRACDLILGCKGRTVVTGMGKSGHIGSKIAATLASTGTPAFFVHPGEASHGDLGMITRTDVVLAISNSGETSEILILLPVLKRLGVPLISLTGRIHSTLAQQSNVHLDVSVDHESCPLGLAPTSSTTAALAMGDAIAVALLQYRGFTAEDFARSHPAGALGRRLLLHVQDVMHQGDAIPLVSPGTTVFDAFKEITHKGLGFCGIVDKDKRLQGIFTDGDLRRTLERGLDVQHTKVDDVMTTNCITIGSDALAVEAAQIMESRSILGLLVTDKDQHVVGAFNMHDLLRASVL